MSRVIKFRGLRNDGKGWVYGYYALWQNEHTIFPESSIGRPRKVIPETVGQLHNGLTKKAGKEVYVGDIIKYNLAEGLGEPKSYNHKCTIENVEIDFYWYIDIEVIGNIHKEREVNND